jgi:hypothetical protein
LDSVPLFGCHLFCLPLAMLLIRNAVAFSRLMPFGHSLDSRLSAKTRQSTPASECRKGVARHAANRDERTAYKTQKNGRCRSWAGASCVPKPTTIGKGTALPIAGDSNEPAFGKGWSIQCEDGIVMSELELINLVRSATSDEVTWFSQMLSVNFAMIVAIYYFLRSAKISLKIFSFVAYTLGMVVFLGEMIGEGNLAYGALEALRALPITQLSRPGAHLLAFADSWVEHVTLVTFNLSVWILWIGVTYLLFFSRKHWASTGIGSQSS